MAACEDDRDDDDNDNYGQYIDENLFVMSS